MYIDLMSPYNLISVNSKLANVLNLNCAVYWAELMNVYSRVINKKKDETIKNNGFFELDRDYITRRTTLSLEEQLLCDETLKKLEILTVDKEDTSKIRIDLEKMCAIILEDDPKMIKQIQKQSKLKRQDATVAKNIALLNNLSVYADEADADIKKAYVAWIESLIEGKKFISKQVVLVFKKNLDEYTENKDVKLTVLEIASIHGWGDFAYCKNEFERYYAKMLSARKISKQKIGVDLNSGF